MIISIILVLITLGLLSVFSWLLFVNREDDKIIETFVQVLVGLIAAIIIIGFRIYSPLEASNAKIKVLVIRDKSRTYNGELSLHLEKINSDYKKGYSILSSIETFDCDNFNRKKFNNETVGFDIIEYALWTWLGERYPTHWDLEWNYFNGISGGGGSAQSSEGADKKTKKYTYAAIREILVENQIMQKEHGRFYEINFPDKTQIEIKERKSNRGIYVISNIYFTLNIKIFKVGQSGLTWTSLGEKLKEEIPVKTDLYTENYIIEFNCTYNKLRRGSPSLIKQKKWIEETINGLSNDFEWTTIKKDLERYYKI